MSGHHYRKDKTCLNCRHVVDQKFCPNCGQENTETRKTFHHLFIHFFEDLTHYENAFWKTIKNLLIRPSALTKEYLSGKRLSYLAPVRLYIFISFVTFFLIAVTPAKDLNFKSSDHEKERLLESTLLSKAEKDSIRAHMKTKSKNEKPFGEDSYKTVKELDSVQKVCPADEKLSSMEYWIVKKFTLVQQNNTPEQIIEKARESITHNFPKVLLIYMPIFAFFLWLFHSKKRWYYFDHGIFTLHYFSFLLLIYLVFYLSSMLLNLFGEATGILRLLSILINVLVYGWMFYYFFPAHHRFYGETRWISFIKSMILFFINMFFITIILLLFFAYTIINIH